MLKDESWFRDDYSNIVRVLFNKLNEVIIEQNHLMKDFELYKKAFKKYCSEDDGESDIKFE